MVYFRIQAVADSRARPIVKPIDPVDPLKFLSKTAVTQYDPNFEKRIELVQRFHADPTQLILALSGGGSLVLGDLLSVPGASRTLLEAAVPYSGEALCQYIRRIPEQFCCQRTTRYMAMTAFHRGLRFLRAEAKNHIKDLVKNDFKSRSVDVSHDVDDSDFFKFGPSGPDSMIDPDDDLERYFHLIGVGCTASLVTDRNKKGEYRVHVAVQTLQRTAVFTLQLLKDVRDRRAEERLVADLILNAIETLRVESLTPPPPLNESKEGNALLSDWREESLCRTFGAGSTDDFKLREELPLFLKEGEKIVGKMTTGSPPLVGLFFSKIWAVLWQNGKIRHFKFEHELPTALSPVYNPQAEFTQAIFPGSFNPVHQGHLEMIDIAEHRLGSRVAMEISIQNIDKPPLDYIELEYRLKKIQECRSGQPVWLTRTPLFEEKAKLFREAMFIVGADTLRRFADLRFYHENTHQLHDVLRMIAYYNCRFLVFARKDRQGQVESLQTLDIPDMLRSLCDEVSSEEFAMNISSSDLRRGEF